MTRVGIELGKRRAFAWAYDWPGWTRSAKDEQSVLEALAAYATRYSLVAASAGVPFDLQGAIRFEVVARVAGNTSTDFGIPAIVTDLDREPTSADEAERLARLLGGCWTVFDRVAAAAPPTLRKGPRGGGRDTARMIEHVVGADHGYTSRIGLKVPAPAATDAPAVRATRGAVLSVLGQASDGSPLGGPKKWPQRYALRYIGYHATDHTWEIEDKSEPA